MKRLLDSSSLLRGGVNGGMVVDDADAVAIQSLNVDNLSSSPPKEKDDNVVLPPDDSTSTTNTNPCQDYTAEESNVLCMHVSKTESGATREKRCNKRIIMSDDKKMHTFVKYICRKTCGLCDGLEESSISDTMTLSSNNMQMLLEEQIRQAEDHNKALESTNNELESRLNNYEGEDKKFNELVHKQQEELYHGGGEIYLTFDDGPLDSTLDVLDVLLELNVRATFFINGFHIFGSGTEENEYDALQAFKRIIDDRHVIANHSFDHMSHNLPVNGYKGTLLLYLPPQIPFKLIFFK